MNGTMPEPVRKARRWLAKERPDDEVRDIEIEKLAAAYDGFIWSLAQGVYGKKQLNPTLQDLDSNNDDDQFRYAEVSINLVKPMVEDWKSVMGILPSIKCAPAKPGDTVSQRRADKREKIIGGVWTDSNMTEQFLDGAHYRTLFGSEVVYLMPEPDLERVRMRVASPYRCHAKRMPYSPELHHLAFDIDYDTEELVEDYPECLPIIEKKGRMVGGRMVYPEEVVVTQWMDRQCRFFLVEDEWIEGLPYVMHGLGYVPGTVIPNVAGINNVWGRSDAHQLVHLSQLISELISMSYDATFQRVYDELVFFADKPITDISAGAFEALQVHQKDAKVELMHAGLQLPEIQTNLSNLERFGRLVAGWPLVQSSELDSSYVSGKAFAAAQGPVAARAALKHMITAVHYQRINSMALMLYEKYFPDREINLQVIDGGMHTSSLPVKAAEPVVFVPRQDIAGDYGNQLVFLPAGMDRYRQTIEMLQLKEARVLSGEFIRQNMPGVDADAIVAQIRRETMEEAENAANAQGLIMQKQMELQAQMLQQQMQAAAVAGGPTPEGSPGGGQAPAAGPSGGAAPRGPAPAGNAGGGGPQPVSGAGGGTPTPAPSNRQAQPGVPRNRVTLAEAKRVFRSLRKIRGEIYLGGSLVSVGYTDGPIDVWLTDPNDGAAVISQTPYGAERRLNIHSARNGRLPDEPLVNVTPAKEQAPEEETEGGV